MSIDRLKQMWAGMGARLGVLVSLAGFVVLFLGWNGAASYNRVPAQMPYVISGGLAGLGLVVLGAAFIVVERSRAERAELRTMLQDLLAAVETRGAAVVPAVSGAEAPTDAVVAGASSFHRSTCHLVEGRTEAAVITRDEAVDRGLTACRICKP
jgi:hypothetical protein